MDIEFPHEGFDSFLNYKLLLFREKPQDTEWIELFEKKKPVLLNYAQCKLNVQDFYPAIEYCTEILKQDPGRLKQLHNII